MTDDCEGSKLTRRDLLRNAGLSALIGLTGWSELNAARARSSSIPLTQVKSALHSTKSHPRLFFSADELPGIRARAKAWPASAFRPNLPRRSGAGGLRPESLVSEGRTPTYEDRKQAETMVDCAFEGIFLDDATATDVARQALLNLSAWKTMGDEFSMAQGGILRDAAIAYDFLYLRLSKTDRAQTEAFLYRGASFLYEGGEKGDSFWSGRDRRLGNWRPQMYSGIGLAGLALLGAHPRAATWVAAAADMMKDVMDHEFDPEGAPYEAYTRYVLGVDYHSIFPMLDALRRVTGEDLFQYNNRVLQRGMPFFAYMLFPARNGMPAIGDSDPDFGNAALYLVKVAAEYDDGLASWYLDTLLRENRFRGSDTLWGTLWARQVPPEDPESSPRLSLAKAYNKDPEVEEMFGSGHVFLRTGFTRPADIQFLFQAGDVGGFHGHADKGGYLLNAYGVRFLRDFFDGPYEGDEYRYYHSGEAHQTVLIDGEGQGTGGIGLKDRDYDEEVARVETLESHPGYDYVRIDSTKAYRINPANSDLQHAIRHVVFRRTDVRTGYFVVIDDVQKDERPHEYSHPFHYDPRDVSVDAKGNHIVLANPQARMHIVIAQPAHEFAAVRVDKWYDHFVVLTCRQPLVRLIMVTVLYPLRDGDVLPALEPIEDASQIGLRVMNTRIVLDHATGRVLVDGSSECEASPAST